MADIAVFDHTAENLGLAIDGERWVGAEGAIFGGRLRQTSQKGSFSKSQIAGAFIEEDSGGGFDAIGGAAVGSGVEIKFKDLVFGINDLGD